jgi:hypothetical protein
MTEFPIVFAVFEYFWPRHSPLQSTSNIRRLPALLPGKK